MTAFLLFMSIPWNGFTDTVAVVEFNEFSDTGITAIIYRDSFKIDKDGLPIGPIVDWRFFTSLDQIPRLTAGGRFLAVWNDNGFPRTVFCFCVYSTRTIHDRELAERKILPLDKRRKLSR